ncbi:MAG: histidine kinase [Nitrospirota bacterium]
MIEPLDKREFQQLTLKRFAAWSVLNALINTVIAFIIAGVGLSKGFAVTLIFSQCIGFSIFFSNLAVLPVYQRATRLRTQVLIVAAAVIAGSIIGTLLGALANGFRPIQFFQEHFGYFTQVILFALLFGFVISYIFISLSVISEEKIKRLEVEKAAMEAELRLVQSQMEPHFLFNTLANVRSLIDSDPRRAGDMLETFVAFLRTSLRTSRERTVPLVQELDVVKNYLDLFTMRMGSRLRYKIELPEALRGVRIPPLLIQPLVENAVKHGLEPSIDGGEVTIAAERADGRIRIKVTDSGVGIREAAGGSGIGLDNVRRRLAIMYGELGRLVIEENSPSGVKATIEIPDELKGTTPHHDPLPVPEVGASRRGERR